MVQYSMPNTSSALTVEAPNITASRSNNSEHIILNTTPPVMLGRSGGADFSYGWVVDGGAGTSISLGGNTFTDRNGTKRVHPRLYFKYIKSKLTKLEQSKLKPQLAKLQAMVKQAKEMNQQALYEVISEKIVGIVRDAEIVAAGLNTYVTQESVEKFLRMAKTEDGAGKVDFLPVENYPRLIPKDIGKKMASLKKKGIFDSFKILFLTYDTTKLKSNKEKIREKDPILFGVTSTHKDRLYFVADWIDEYCDLTLDKFLEKVPASDTILKPVDDTFIEELRQEVMARAERLANTNRGNFRDLMVQEDKVSSSSALNTLQRFAKRVFRL